MNFNDGVAWCKNVHGKQVKIMAKYDEFLLCTKALETYEAGVVTISSLTDFSLL